MILGTATSAEILKNLVLPGIGSFTIIDDAKVSNEDLGNNFFVDHESLGKSRAQTVTNQLLELNPFVEGKAVEQNPHTLIDEKIEFFGDFTMVLADAVRDTQLNKLAEFLWKKRIPLVITRSYGFIGYLRLVVPEHSVVEAHGPEVFDLRIQNPWPELQKHWDLVDLEIKDENEQDKVSAHSHIPWLVLVYRFYEQYKKENDGKECPRKDFGKYIMDQRVTNTKTGGKYVEENFDEATKNCWRAFQKYSIPGDIKSLMNDPAVSKLSSECDPFWYLVAALKKFVEVEGEGKFLPVPGNIPDMHSSTKNFIELQRVYQEKAEKDQQSLTKHLETIIATAGKPKFEITAEEIKRFCKNAGHLRVVRYTSYNSKPDVDTINDMLENEDEPEMRNVIWYLLIRAASSFEAKNSRYPGQNDTDVASDIPLLKQEFETLVKDMGITIPEATQSQLNDYLSEVVRYGGCEMHNIAAFQGGVVSLEMIKLATHQWVPLCDTFIFNGINGSACSFQLSQEESK